MMVSLEISLLRIDVDVDLRCLLRHLAIQPHGLGEFVQSRDLIGVGCLLARRDAGKGGKDHGPAQRYDRRPIGAALALMLNFADMAMYTTIVSLV